MGGRTIAVVNQKGGAAKTTTAGSVAAILGERGHRVLLIDLDPQGSLTRWLGHDTQGDGLVWPLVRQTPLEEVVVATAWPGVELVPAAEFLNGADVLLQSIAVDRERRLRQAIEAAPTRDFVLLDCPPGLGQLVINALAAADEALIPVPTGSAELDGVASLLGTLAQVRSRYNPGLRLYGILATRYHTGQHVDGLVLDTLRRRFSAELLPVTVHEDTKFRHLRGAHQPITRYDPNGRGSQEYRQVVETLLQTVAVSGG